MSGRHFKSAAGLATLCVILGYTGKAIAYVDLAPTLGKVVADSKAIALVEVAAFDPSAQTVTLKPLRTIKGSPATEAIVNHVAPPGGLATPAVRRWAEPGSRGVWFATKTTALVCIGPVWYQMKATGDGGWKLGIDRPDLALAYCGAVTRLADAVETMLAGKSAVLTAVVYGATDVDTSFDLALGRTNLPGLARVQRVRGSLSMPPMVVAAASSGDYVIGAGPADAADLPRLRESLKSADAATRAEAAESIGQLGADGRDAAADLCSLFNDPASVVRTSAAAALLRTTPTDADARGVLERDLKAADAPIRRDAAAAVALAGDGAAALVPALLPLLAEADDAVRSAALAAVTTVGPAIATADAISAGGTLRSMLGDPRWRVEAADALGRLGPVARPVPAALSAMLNDPQPAVQWAAVRAMSQIGGPEARPAVEFIQKKLPAAPEVEQYNMMIYLSLLGPVAADAAPVIRSSRIKNPVLPGATLWAIGDTTKMPWTIADDRRGPFGFGPPPGGGPDDGGPGDIKRYMYSAYIRELGPRLKPAADAFTKQLLDGKAGDVPEWGYAFLTVDPAASLATLAPKLTDGDRQVRQRAAVALGYMGAAAAPALPDLKTAAAAATDAREKRLMAWSVKKLSTP